MCKVCRSIKQRIGMVEKCDDDDDGDVEIKRPRLFENDMFGC